MLYRSAAHAEQLRRWCHARLGEWHQPHTTRTVATGLGAVHLTDVPAADGAAAATCVYLPGTNFNAATSRAVLETLAARYAVVCVDLPGQPGLSTPRRPSSPTAERDWLAEVLPEVAPDSSRPLVLVGHSRGAAVALCADPSWADAVALVSPAGLSRVALSASMLRATVPWLLRPDRPRSRRLVALMSAPAHAPGALDTAERGRPDDPAARELLAEWLELVARSARTTGAPGPLPAAVLTGWRGRPVTVLTGAHDVFFPPRRLAQAARASVGVDVETVAGAGHLLPEEQPGAVGAAVDSLLRQGG